MHKIRSKQLLCLIFGGIFVYSCQAPGNPIHSFNGFDKENEITDPGAEVSASKPQKSEYLTFVLNFSDGFQTKCASCQPRYIKLQIKGSQNISEPLYAVNADTNGFIEINPDLPVQNLSAQVPEGNNWAAFAGLYADNTVNAQPISEIGGVFHNPPPTQSQIELSKRALQTAHIVNAMHDLGDERIFSPLDLQRYQAMTDALLGVEQDENGSYTLGRVPDGEILDAETLARLLDEGVLNPEQPETASQLPLEQVLPRPKVQGSVQVQAFTAGLSKLVLNPENGTLFSFDIKQNQRWVYGFQVPGLTPLRMPYALGELRNVYLSLGVANPTGSDPQPVSFTYANQGVDRMFLSAHHQNTGQLLWQYDFEDVPALRSDYVPTVWRNPRGTPADPSDDTARVFVTLNADPFNHAEKRGVYAVEDGEEIWRLPINNDFNTAGALNAAGTRLYLLGRSDPSTPSTLYALHGVNTDAPTVEWELEMPGQTFTSSTPVLGHNGDIYLTTYTMPFDYQLGDSLPGKLVCISPTGQIRWSYDLASSSGWVPVVDYRDGEDHIYLTTDRGQVLALSAEGNLRWATLLPGTAGEGPVDAPIIGADVANGRTLYQGMGNGLIYAVKDRGDYGEILWAQAPQAKVSRGMVLHDHKLYVPTLDGGEGQMVQIKEVQVHSAGVPPDAPWPMTGGNLSGQNIATQNQATAGGVTP